MAAKTFKIEIGEQEFDCPPLKYGQFRRGALKTISELKDIRESAQRATDLFDPATDVFNQASKRVVALFQAALSRKYPDVTLDWMDDNASFGDIQTMFAKFPALMEISGFEAAPGEAQSGSMEATENPSQIGDGSPDA